MILVVASLLLYRRSLATAITHNNVNDEWPGKLVEAKDDPPVKIAA